jgi:hypothetical protein
VGQVAGLKLPKKVPILGERDNADTGAEIVDKSNAEKYKAGG